MGEFIYMCVCIERERGEEGGGRFMERPKYPVVSEV